MVKNMDKRRILSLLATRLLWLLYVSLSTSTHGNPKLVAADNQHTHRRELATENPGFISIDCGSDEDYVDEATGIFYKSDADFISTGKNKDISPEYTIENPYIGRQLKNIRIFPEGRKNCYTLKPEQGKNHNYLIRVFFMYGNYDAKNQTPKYDLYFGVNYWATVELESADDMLLYEITHISLDDTIYVCLVNTGFGIPFISTLQLRLLNDSTYTVEPSSSASLIIRTYDLCNPPYDDDFVRYKDDVYDRLWASYWVSDWVLVNTTSDIDISRNGSNNLYKVPVEVLRSAAQPQNINGSLSYKYENSYSDRYFYINFYFTEITEIAPGQRREFTITVNGFNYGPITLEYLKPLTIRSYKTPLTSQGVIDFSINPTLRSDLPPILNAFELYREYPLPLSATDSSDADAIMAIKMTYKINRIDWQGDPCVPRDFSWSGLTCSNIENPPRIISLNLTASNLTGEIASSISNLKAIQSLDLSNNELNGAVPEFLAHLSNLTILNLSGNKFTGSIPQSLIDKSENGTLFLSLERNPNTCKTNSCEEKKHSFLVPIIASIISTTVLLLLCIITIVWRMRRRGVTAPKKEPSLKSENQYCFTYSEIVSITNNFRMIVGEGGFGKVYLGDLQDGTQVAVKVLSQASMQGYKEFQSETFNDSSS